MHYRFVAANLFSFRSAACFVEVVVVCLAVDVAAADHVVVAACFVAVAFAAVAGVVVLVHLA
jgi:hypothetical protein